MSRDAIAGALAKAFSPGWRGWAMVLAAIGAGCMLGAVFLVQSLYRIPAARPALAWASHVPDALRDPCASYTTGITAETLLEAGSGAGDRSAVVAEAVACVHRADDRAALFRTLRDRAVDGHDSRARAAYEAIARVVCRDLDALSGAQSLFGTKGRWSCADILIAGNLPSGVFPVAEDERAALARFAELAALLDVGIVHAAITEEFCADPAYVAEVAGKLGWSDLPMRAQAYCATQGIGALDAGTNVQ